MYRHLIIDTDSNKLLCSPTLVGNGELAEIYSLDDTTPPQASGRLLKKLGDPNLFEATEHGEGAGRRYEIGEKCILRVMYKNVSGVRRRRFSKEEKTIVAMEHCGIFKEKKVAKAKTGSVRKKKG